MKKEFKFKFKKGGKGKIVSFDLKQLDGYCNFAKMDFIAILMEQLNRANNDTVSLDCNINFEAHSWVEEYNNWRAKAGRNLIDLHLYRAITDYCTNCVSISAITDFVTILDMLEMYYNTIQPKTKDLGK